MLSAKLHLLIIAFSEALLYRASEFLALSEWRCYRDIVCRTAATKIARRSQRVEHFESKLDKPDVPKLVAASTDNCETKWIQLKIASFESGDVLVRRCHSVSTGGGGAAKN